MNSIKNIMSQILKEKLSAFNDDNDLIEKILLCFDISWSKTKLHIYYLFKKTTTNYKLTRKNISQILNVSEFIVKKWFNDVNDESIPYIRMIELSYILDTPLQQLIVLNIDDESYLKKEEKEKLLQIFKVALQFSIESHIENTEKTKQNYIQLTKLIFVKRIIDSYIYLSKNYITSTDCLICTFPLLSQYQLYDIFTRIAGHNNSKHYERYIANYLLNNRDMSRRTYALQYFHHLTEKYYLDKDTFKIMHKERKAFYKLIRKFQRLHYSKKFIKYFSSSHDILKNYNFKPIVSYKDIVKHLDHVHIETKPIETNDYSFLFEVNWKQTKKNIKYLLDLLLEATVYDDKETSFEEYMTIIQELFNIKANITTWLSTNQPYNNAKIFFIILKLFPCFSSEIITYNYECSEYQLLLDKYKKEMKKRTANSEYDTNYFHYKSMIKKENTYSIADLFMMLPLLTKDDLYHLKDQFTTVEKHGHLNTEHIVSYIVKCAKRSPHVSASEFVFASVEFFHKNKYLQLTEADPTIELLRYYPGLAGGGDEYLELSNRFQYLYYK